MRHRGKQRLAKRCYDLVELLDTQRFSLHIIYLNYTYLYGIPSAHLGPVPLCNLLFSQNTRSGGLFFCSFVVLGGRGLRRNDGVFYLFAMVRRPRFGYTEWTRFPPEALFWALKFTVSRSPCLEDAS